jgi:hypothetical protein
MRWNGEGRTGLCNTFAIVIIIICVMACRMLFAEDGLLKPLNQMTELTIHILFCERDQVS